MREYDYFSARELSCKCGQCDGGEMDVSFMQRLIFIREQTGIPMNVTSGFRCEAHNRQVSHTGSAGPHTTGKAVDVQCSGKDAHELLKVALQVGMTGIGIQQKGNHSNRFIHFDSIEDFNTRPWIWSY